MTDFLVALGLVFVIEGLIFAASPGAAKNAMAHVLDTPDNLYFVLNNHGSSTQILEGTISNIPPQGGRKHPQQGLAVT